MSLIHILSNCPECAKLQDTEVTFKQYDVYFKCTECGYQRKEVKTIGLRRLEVSAYTPEEIGLTQQDLDEIRRGM